MPLFKYEHRGQPLVSRREFLRRMAVHGGVGFAAMIVALAIGMAGYAATERMGMLDAFLNAAMILSGMGPAAEMRTDAGKLFAGIYSLFSGVVFLAIAGVMFAPLAHRLLHKLHAAPEDDPDK